MKYSILSVLALTVASTAFSAVKVENVSARQLWPWKHSVEIRYSVTNSEGGSGWTRVRLSSEGEEIQIVDSSLSGDVQYKGDGDYSIFWNPDSGDFGDKKILTSFSVAVTVDDIPLYKVYDLDGINRKTGECQFRYVYADDLRAGKWGAYVENPISGISSLVWTGVNADEYKTSKIVFRYIPSGSVRDEWNNSTINLDSPVWAGVFEVTVAQLDRLTNRIEKGSSTLPAQNVSYIALRGKASEGINYPETGARVKEGSIIDLIRGSIGEKLVDVPMLDEWRYLARAGATTVFVDNCFVPDAGSDISSESFNSAEVDAVVATYGFFRPFGGSIPNSPLVVGSKSPNAWGLYDVHGNAWEWTHKNGDRYRAGGSYQVYAHRCRLANAESTVVTDAGASNGFRLIFPVSAK